MGMTKEESLGLFNYLGKEFAKINHRLERTATKEDVDRVYVILDGMRATLDKHEIEYAAISAQTTRHENWIQKASKQLKLPYGASR